MSRGEQHPGVLAEVTEERCHRWGLALQGSVCGISIAARRQQHLEIIQ